MKFKHVRSYEKLYTLGEELFNSISHGIGAALSVAALVLLIVHAASSAPVGLVGPYVVGASVFGGSLVILYTMSTLYHAFTPSLTKKVFSILDHSAIYILIAGTYTGFCLSILYGALGWVFFGIIWFLAFLGIVLTSVWPQKTKKFSLILYLLMGWLIVFAAPAIYQKTSALGWYLLLWGGLAYTIGCVFFVLKKIRWMHSIWHLFVLAGSILHFFALYFSY